jgi:pimeloyl-ACP methyl ester carboxylesterase
VNSISISDTTLNVVDRGSGRVILLVHGFPLDHSMWSHQIEDLSSDFRVLAPDLRGFGGSGGADEILTMARLADDLDELLDAMEIREPVVFCGLSMGGYVAWPFFQRHRDRIRALILCDTRAGADTPDVAHGRLYLADRVLREGTLGMSEEMLRKLFADDTRQQAPATLQATFDVMKGSSPQSIAAALRGMAERADMRNLLPKIDCPVLVLCGEHDQITPPAEMEAMAAEIESATWQIIPHAGHLAPLENPTAVNQAIRSFMAL